MRRKVLPLTMKSKSPMSRRRFLSCLLLLLVALWVFAFVFYTYQTNLEIREKTAENLEKRASAQNTLLSNTLDLQFRTLEAFCGYLDTLDPKAPDVDETVFAAAQALVDHQLMMRVTFADTDGNAVSNDGQASQIAQLSYFQQLLAGETRVFSAPLTSEADEAPMIALAVPIRGEADLRGVMVAFYDANALGNALLSPLYPSGGYCFICDRNGNVLVCAESEAGTFLAQNLFSGAYYTATADAPTTIDMMRYNLYYGNSATYYVLSGSEALFLVQTPLAYNGWSLMTAVPASVTDEDYAFIKQYNFLLDIVITGTFFACIIVVVAIMSHDKKLLRLSARENRIVVQQANRLLMRYDVKARTLYLIGASAQFFGRDLLTDVPERLLREGIVAPEDGQSARDFFNAIAAGSPSGACTVHVCLKNRPDVWLQLDYTTLFSLRNRPEHAILSVEDVTKAHWTHLEDQKRMETDPLTGLLNRSAFISRLDDLFSAAPNGRHALVILDIDDFKRINDRFGHAEGDRALMLVGEKLSQALRQDDLIGRLGGDEFMLCLRYMQSGDVLDGRLLHIRKTLEFVFGQDLTLSVSLGAALFPADGTDFETLYRKADAALYDAKRNGKNAFRIYTAGMQLCERKPKGEPPEDGQAE